MTNGLKNWQVPYRPARSRHSDVVGGGGATGGTGSMVEALLGVMLHNQLNGPLPLAKPVTTNGKGSGSGNGTSTPPTLPEAGEQ